VRIFRFARRHPVAAGTSSVLLAGGLAFGLFWFSPWLLFVDKRVNDPVPAASSSADPTPAITPSPEDPSGDAAEKQSPAPAGPTVLASGEFRSLEHGSSGRAVILELADGSRYLRFENLNTSNGPDLRVLLSVHPIDDDWYVWDNHEFLDLGGLQGNIGSQNYELPGELDLAKYRTAVVWCRRFHVGFAVAPLDSD
jgi:hypothetical protein